MRSGNLSFFTVPHGPHGSFGSFGSSLLRGARFAPSGIRSRVFFSVPSSSPSSVIGSSPNAESLATSSGIGVSFFRPRFVWYPFFSIPHFNPRLFSSPASNLKARQSPVLLFHRSSKLSEFSGPKEPDETFEP